MASSSSSSNDDVGPISIQPFPYRGPQREGSSKKNRRTEAVKVASLAVIALATLLLALYICINLRRRIQRRRRRRRSAVTVGDLGGAQPHDSGSPGLDPAGIQRLPIIVIPAKMESHDYAAAEMTLTDCSICISELRGGHKARVLPACGHLFHVQCIDTWLLSHCTCPLCRNAVVAPTEPTPPPPTVSANQSPASTSAAASMRKGPTVSGTADVAIDVGDDVAVAGPPEGEETRQSSSSSSGKWGVGRILSRDRTGGSGRVYPEPYAAAAHDSSLHSDVAAYDSSTLSSPVLQS